MIKEVFDVLANDKPSIKLSLLWDAYVNVAEDAEMEGKLMQRAHPEPKSQNKI